MGDKISTEKVSQMKEMWDSGQPIKDVSSETGLKHGTVNHYFTAWNQGFGNLREYYDNLAEKRGFKNFADYQTMRKMAYGNSKISKQEAFECAMVPIRVDLDFFKGYLPFKESEVLRTKCTAEKVFDTLRNCYIESKRGRGYGTPEWDRLSASQRAIMVLEEIYVNSETISNLGKRFGVSRQNIHAVRSRALEKLQEIVSRNPDAFG